jgi:aryl-alcohol dehydrogenase-like predicted oxidoreductase
MVSRLGFGCAALSGYDYGPIDEGEAVRAIRRAYDLGVNLFDTADVYGFGRAEKLLRNALGKRRHDVVIATKGGMAWDEGGRTRRDTSPGHLRGAVEASLVRLGVDAVSLFQVHWLDGRTPIGDTIEALTELRQAGKIRHLGMCNVGSDEVATAQQHGRVESLQLPLSLLERQHRPTLDDAQGTHGMATLAYNVLGQGLLAGATPDRTRLAASDLRFRSPLFQPGTYDASRRAHGRVTAEATLIGRSPAQVAIRWVLDQPGVTAALVGAKTRVQVEDNAGALGWTSDPDSLRRLSEPAPDSPSGGDGRASGRQAGRQSWEGGSV